MQTESSQRGEMSQDSGGGSLHPEVVTNGRNRRRERAVDPAAGNGKRAFDALAQSSVGLELGLSVIIGLLIGYGLDAKFETGPWLMLLFLGFGLVAGFRGVLRAVGRAERSAEADSRG